jgi:hypothetical protein
MSGPFIGPAWNGALVTRLERGRAGGLQATYKDPPSACKGAGGTWPHGHEDGIEAPGRRDRRGVRRARRSRKRRTGARGGHRIERPACSGAIPNTSNWSVGRPRGSRREELAVPAVDVHFHPDTSGCYGHLGSQLGGRVDVCVVIVSEVARETLLHEMGHAWIDEKVTDSVRERFLEMRGLRAWNESTVPWDDRGFGHGTEISRGVSETGTWPRRSPTATRRGSPRGSSSSPGSGSRTRSVHDLPRRRPGDARRRDV